MTIRGSNGYFGYTKFLNSLKAMPPDAIVGERASYSSCPIAREIQQLIPNTDYVSVNDGRILYHIRGEPIDHRHPTPEWAIQFITDIDANAFQTTKITAAEAIAAMERIKR